MTTAEPPLPGVDADLPVQRPRVTCRLCGRPLRGRAARTWGLGSECRTKLAIRTAPTPPEHEVEQDALPGM